MRSSIPPLIAIKASANQSRTGAIVKGSLIIFAGFAFMLCLGLVKMIRDLWEMGAHAAPEVPAVPHSAAVGAEVGRDTQEQFCPNRDNLAQAFEDSDRQDSTRDAPLRRIKSGDMTPEIDCYF